MTTLSKKIDFAAIIYVQNANPNGDPLNGNRPRYNFDGYGEISDVALKRKISIPVGIDGAMLDRDVQLKWLQADAYFRRHPITIRTKPGARPIRDVP